ncbi:RNA polymerase sigma factor [Lysinibacillus sp. S2017]|uniref:RNA polymerase sigma factor n=1 Tax=Lysinibacillus sp. S2017 TaxID=2561923 RepID=UPI001091AF90|nr:RNA polymerase sigma factor [Lysinibacillus sp. S2017]TGN33115.1 RNA polymerase sigma factor [Lysinibacillus sp. S2017]
MYTNITHYKVTESDEVWMEDLLEKYHRKIFRYCYHILRDIHDAEDATQEVFMKAFKSSSKTKITNSNAWLYKIAYNHCLNKLKRKSIVTFLPFNEGYKIAEESIDNINFELNFIISKLKPKERTLIVLRIIEDKDYADIASILGISQQTARKRFERVKEKIQKIIERRNNDGQ